jgi:hypothetical protein
LLSIKFAIVSAQADDLFSVRDYGAGLHGPMTEIAGSRDRRLFFVVGKIHVPLAGTLLARHPFGKGILSARLNWPNHGNEREYEYGNTEKHRDNLNAQEYTS